LYQDESGNHEPKKDKATESPILVQCIKSSSKQIDFFPEEKALTTQKVEK
jgi:hypothetical protein